MSIPTPIYNLKSFPNVYEPSEDTFLLMDALESDLEFIKSLSPTYIAEVGCGSGLVITSLASVLKGDCWFFATDINVMACRAASNTANVNEVSIECLEMNLLDNFRDALFDVILFNPPYVVTESDEITGRSLCRAWAGGQNGREIIDKFLPKLQTMLSKQGVCYLVVCKENRLNEIEECAQKWGFSSKTVKERRILGEHLFVLKFARKFIN